MNSKFLPSAVLLAAGFLAGSAHAQTAETAIYISPTGSDSNNGLSVTAPLQNFEKAQQLLRAAPAGKKTLYLLGGTYTLSKTIKITGQDADETWQAYPGQVPVLDGGGTVQAFSLDAKNFTMRGLTIQNVLHQGINIRAGDHVWLDSNTIKNIICDGWNQGGIVSNWNFTNGTITHNLIENSGYSGIQSATSENVDISNLKIDNNIVYNTCTTVKDCGAIYVNDRGYRSKNVQITHNIVKNYGPHNFSNKAIYLDDNATGVLVSDNIVFGSGEEAFQIHGGDHNLIQNNIFDISGAQRLGWYQDNNDPTQNHGMVGNVFRCNVVHSSEKPPRELWNTWHPQPVAMPVVSNNLYWSTKGQMPNKGEIVDTAPTFADPGFAKAGSEDYSVLRQQIKGRVPNFCADFHDIDTSQAGPLKI